MDVTVGDDFQALCSCQLLYDFDGYGRVAALGSRPEAFCLRSA